VKKKENGNKDVSEYFQASPFASCSCVLVAIKIPVKNSGFSKSCWKAYLKWPKSDIFREQNSRREF
jgi:hypothetical protein